jgi:hypothetical protein
MKRFFILGLIAFTVTASVSAGWGGPGIGPSGHGLPEAGDSGSALTLVTVSGTLEVIAGSPAVREGSNIYYVKSLGRLMRSVPGLAAGAKVTLRGYTSKILDDGVVTGHYFKTAQLTFNGTTYTIAY